MQLAMFLRYGHIGSDLCEFAKEEVPVMAKTYCYLSFVREYVEVASLEAGLGIHPTESSGQDVDNFLARQPMLERISWLFEHQHILWKDVAPQWDEVNPSDQSPPSAIETSTSLMCLPDEILGMIVTEVLLSDIPSGVVKVHKKPLTSIFRVNSQLRHMAYQELLTVCSRLLVVLDDFH